MDFEEAESRFQRLGKRRERGELDEAQYRVEVAKLLVHDADGAFWMIDAESGAWFCNRGEGWFQAEPGAEGGVTADAEPGARLLSTARRGERRDPPSHERMSCLPRAFARMPVEAPPPTRVTRHSQNSKRGRPLRSLTRIDWP